jgi:hypothetical protein
MAQLTFFLQGPGLFTLFGRVFMTADTARMEGSPGGWRFGAFLLAMALMTGFDRLTRLALEGMVTGRAFGEAQVRMFPVHKSHNPELGIKLDSRRVSRYGKLFANRTASIAQQQHQYQEQFAHDTHLTS